MPSISKRKVSIVRNVARDFGRFLDRDDFAATRRLLDDNCAYDTGSEIFYGAEAICSMYEENMKKARIRFDELVWGRSEVELLNDHTAIVLFTDYLRHKGFSHTYRCKQLLEIGDHAKIIGIKHLEVAEEAERLARFYERCGLIKE